MSITVEEGSLGKCVANSRLLGGFLSLIKVRKVNRTGRYKEGTFNCCPEALIKCLLQTRVLVLIGKFFLPIAWTHCFKRDVLLNGSWKNEK